MDESKEELLRLCNESRAEANALLLKEVKSFQRFFAKVRKLNMKMDHEGVAAAYKNVKLTQKDYRQHISVRNKYIDVVLRRYLMEAAMKDIIVDCGMHSLEDVSNSLAVEVVNTLKTCFIEILSHPKGSHLFLVIKIIDDEIVFSVNTIEEELFTQVVVI